MKEQKPVQGLDELLGLQNDAAPSDLTAYRRLAQLKGKDTVSQDLLAKGYEDLLRRREARNVITRRRSTWWMPGSIAALALVAVSTILLTRTPAPTVAAITAAELGENVAAQNIALAENKLVSAKIETVDLQFRGVTGFSALSTRDELMLRFDAGFLNIEYQPDSHRKRLVVKVRDTTFTVTGTKFFVQATPEVRLVVTEGRVLAEVAGKKSEVTQAEMWTETQQTVQKISQEQKDAYAKSFADTSKGVSQISISSVAEKTAPPARKDLKRVRLHLGLGQIISGTLTAEDSESVSIVTSSGKQLRISRSEIEKVEHLR